MGFWGVGCLHSRQMGAHTHIRTHTVGLCVLLVGLMPGWSGTAVVAATAALLATLEVVAACTQTHRHRTSSQARGREKRIHEC